ncbi:MAG TPA: tetratricopeptide repeat protein [Devosiaceae bacterium]|jgi:tetratricopeptide (TPR) repeat protein|nr:tetratricopeptide repeat protein [Devosiaceae bacterium]
MPQPKISTLSAAAKRRIEQAMQQALALHQGGRIREAEILYRQVLAQQPMDPAANHLLGLVRMQQGKLGDAVELISRAVAQRPKDPQFHCNLGVALNAAGQPEPAILSFSRAIELKPDYPEAFSNRGMALKNVGRPAEAAESYLRAIALKPQEAGFHLNLANTHTAMGDLHEAEAAYRKALELRPGYPAALSGLSQTLEALGRADEAVAAGEAAVKSRPNEVEYHRALGRAYRASGDLEQAAASFRRALEIVPTDAESYRLLSEVVRRRSRDAEVVEMERLLDASAPGSDDRMHLGYALGRAFDDIGEFSRSIECFTEANVIRRRAGEFSIEQARRDLLAIQRLFREPLPDRLLRGGFTDDAPIFVLGLPRSGKTTLEGMLARHPDVYGAGELRLLNKLSSDLIIKHGLTGDGASLDRVPEEELTALGAEYSRYIRQLSPFPSIIVDTMPQNFRTIGFIRLALPRAKVIHCMRGPEEHAIALFQKYFARAGYEYTCDWAELSAFFALYREVMGGWEAAFPGFVRALDVSRLKTDPEAEMRKLLQFCGLGWSDACADPYESEPRLGDQPEQPDMAARRLEHYRPLLSPLMRGDR